MTRWLRARKNVVEAPCEALLAITKGSGRLGGHYESDGYSEERGALCSTVPWVGLWAQSCQSAVLHVLSLVRCTDGKFWSSSHRHPTTEAERERVLEAHISKTRRRANIQEKRQRGRR